MRKLDRSEFPRPDFVRRRWVSLNGTWDFSFDKPVFDRKITVPFCYQSQLSGIEDTADHDVVWYRRKFRADMDMLANCSLLLKFGAVDYGADIYVNGVFLYHHEGGQSAFEVEISGSVQEENTLEVRVTDFRDADKPRGKQTWAGKNFGCWYTPVTGIWQNVWLEYAGKIYAKRVKITPDLDQNLALCELFISDMNRIEAEASFSVLSGEEKDSLPLGSLPFTCEDGYGKCILALPDLDLRRDLLVWTPEKPNLIQVRLTVSDGLGNDEVETYFGMRSVGFKNGKFLLNGNAYFQRLVLDQGYWPESLLTPPDGEAVRSDILTAKSMGFNGARKHQKIEDPRYYYWADRLGFFVWAELPSCYKYTDNTVRSSAIEMMDFIERDYNHPCIVTWVPVNESWGIRNVKTDIRQQSFSNMMIFLIKSLDNTRPVSGNDGWEQTENTDILSIHDYSITSDNLSRYDDMDQVIDGIAESRPILADGQKYRNQPVFLTEFGGISLACDGKGWSYHNARDESEFLAMLAPVVEFLVKSGKFAGFCYTQLTDVMQEVNGLLYNNRTPKISVEKLRAIFSRDF